MVENASNDERFKAGDLDRYARHVPRLKHEKAGLPRIIKAPPLVLVVNRTVDLMDSHDVEDLLCHGKHSDIPGTFFGRLITRHGEDRELEVFDALLGGNFFVVLKQKDHHHEIIVACTLNTRPASLVRLVEMLRRLDDGITSKELDEREMAAGEFDPYSIA